MSNERAPESPARLLALFRARDYHRKTNVLRAFGKAIATGRERLETGVFSRRELSRTGSHNPMDDAQGKRNTGKRARGTRNTT